MGDLHGPGRGAVRCGCVSVQGCVCCALCAVCCVLCAVRCVLCAVQLGAGFVSLRIVTAACNSNGGLALDLSTPRATRTHPPCPLPPLQLARLWLGTTLGGCTSWTRACGPPSPVCPCTARTARYGWACLGCVPVMFDQRSTTLWEAQRSGAVAMEQIQAAGGCSTPLAMCTCRNSVVDSPRLQHTASQCPAN